MERAQAFAVTLGNLVTAVAFIANFTVRNTTTRAQMENWYSCCAFFVSSFAFTLEVSLFLVHHTTSYDESTCVLLEQVCYYEMGHAIVTGVFHYIWVAPAFWNSRRITNAQRFYFVCGALGTSTVLGLLSAFSYSNSIQNLTPRRTAWAMMAMNSTPLWKILRLYIRMMPSEKKGL